MKRLRKALVNVALWPVSSDAVVQAVAVLALVGTIVVLVLALSR